MFTAEQIARDYKNGMTYSELSAKYNFSSYVIRRMFKNFKADWFNFEEISKHHTKSRLKSQKNSYSNVNVYKTLFDTLKNIGLSNTEAIDIINIIVRNKKEKVEENSNNAIVQNIIHKTNSEILKQVLL